MYGRLVQIYDETVQELLTIENISADTIHEIIIDEFAGKVLSLKNNEAPADVRNFLESLLAFNGQLEEVEWEGQDAGEDMPRSEFVSRHVKSHTKHNQLVMNMFNWILPNAPKGFPPTIVFYLLEMCANYLYGSLMHMAEELFGGELPESKKADQEDPEGEEGENEEPA